MKNFFLRFFLYITWFIAEYYYYYKAIKLLSLLTDVQINDFLMEFSWVIFLQSNSSISMSPSVLLVPPNSLDYKCKWINVYVFDNVECRHFNTLDPWFPLFDPFSLPEVTPLPPLLLFLVIFHLSVSANLHLIIDQWMGLNADNESTLEENTLCLRFGWRSVNPRVVAFGHGNGTTRRHNRACWWTWSRSKFNLSFSAFSPITQHDNSLMQWT